MTSSSRSCRASGNPAGPSSMSGELEAQPWPRSEAPASAKAAGNSYPLRLAPPRQSSTLGLLTSASLHDSQAAIPLATLSAERTTNLYDLMDAAYDAEPIRQHSRSLGHVPLIDTNPRRDKALAEELRTEARRLQRIGFQLPEQARYNERTAGERVNGRLKDEFGGRHVRVRGASKVMCHCMFGVLALTADQLVRLVT